MISQKGIHTEPYVIDGEVNAQADPASKQDSFLAHLQIHVYILKPTLPSRTQQPELHHILDSNFDSDYEMFPLAPSSSYMVFHSPGIFVSMIYQLNLYTYF